MGRVLAAMAVDIHRISGDDRLSAVLTPLEISPTITTYEAASSRLIQSERFVIFQHNNKLHRPIRYTNFFPQRN